MGETTQMEYFNYL